MASARSKKKVGTITIRNLEDEQHVDSQGSFQEEQGEQGEQGDQSPPNEDSIAKIAEFVNENPGIFKQLGRFFKRKGKEKAESSKRRLDHSHPEASGRRSVSK